MWYILACFACLLALVVFPAIVVIAACVASGQADEASGYK